MMYHCFHFNSGRLKNLWLICNKIFDNTKCHDHVYKLLSLITRQIWSPSFSRLLQKLYRCIILTHMCLALALQYLRALSGSLIRRSRQHCAQANFIFMPRLFPTPPPGLLPPPPEDNYLKCNEKFKVTNKCTDSREITH